MVPQLLLIVLTAVGLGLQWADHGKTKTARQSVVPSVIATAIVQLLLYWGGFYDVFFGG